MDRCTTYQLAAWQDLKSKAKRATANSEFSKAEELLLQAYEHAKDIYGRDHGEVGLILLHLVEVCEKQGKVELAAKFHDETDLIVKFYELDAE